MPSAAQLAKRDKYLIEGKVQVVAYSTKLAVFTVKGSSDDPYEVRFEEGVWVCDCPAQMTACVHVLAVRLLCPLGAKDEAHGLEIEIGSLDLDELLG